MSSVYVLGGVGPWEADDDLVHSDGHFSSGVGHATNGPTVDGLSGPRRTRFGDEADDLIKGRVLRYEDRRI